MKRDVAIVGAGYVGVPLAYAFAEVGKNVVLVDIDAERVARLNRGESYIEDIPSETLQPHVEAGRISATTDYDELRDADAILIALPTPLSRQREPDLRILVSAAEEIAKRLRPGHLVVLESTTYPGTTREQVLPVLEAGSGLRAGSDFHLAFSPERVDPGREDWTTKTVPKVVGGIDEASTEAAAAFYASAIDEVHRVSSPEAAELTKLLENIFRSVNIALVNELAQLCDRMGIDVWEVVEAAATKPFGFMSFKPGPGLGGHCIPVDPFYLTWKAREYGFYTEFIELAGKVNESMPYFCRSVVSQALNHSLQLSLSGSRILVLGVAYKPNISDTRESPAVKLIALLKAAGADVSYHDPHVPSFRENGVSMTLVAARRGVLRLRGRRHRPLRASTTTSSWKTRGSWSTSATRPAPTGRAPTRSGSCDGPRRGRPGSATGARTSRATSPSWPSSRGSATRIPARARSQRRYPRASWTASFDEMLADPELDAVIVATPVPTHFELARARARRGQARPGREAARDDRRGDGRARRARAGSRPRPDAGTPAPLPPGRPAAEGDDRRRRAR